MKSSSNFTIKALLSTALTVILSFTSSQSIFAEPVQVLNLSSGSINTSTNTVTVPTSSIPINFTVNASSSCAPSELAIYAFDGNVYSKYCYDSAPLSSNTITLHYLNAVVNPRQLTLTTASDSTTYPERNPLRWKLYGSSDGASWTLIRDNTDSDFLVPIDNVTDYESDSFLDYTAFHSHLKFEIIETLYPTNIIQFSELKILGNFSYVAACAFKGNSGSAKNSVGQSKSSSPASSKSNGAGACQNSASR